MTALFAEKRWIAVSLPLQKLNLLDCFFRLLQGLHNTASDMDAEKSEDAPRRFNSALAEHARVKRMLGLRRNDETIPKAFPKAFPPTDP